MATSISTASTTTTGHTDTSCTVMSAAIGSDTGCCISCAATLIVGAAATGLITGAAGTGHTSCMVTRTTGTNVTRHCFLGRKKYWVNQMLLIMTCCTDLHEIKNMYNKVHCFNVNSCNSHWSRQSHHVMHDWLYTCSQWQLDLLHANQQYLL